MRISYALRHACIVVIISTIFCASCGWQLRGYEQYKSGAFKEIKSVHLRSSADNRLFESAIEQQLTDLGVEITSATENTLTIISEHTERRPLSYGSTGIPVQYQLIMTISFSYRETADAVALEQQYTARRQYDFDSTLVVAKREEERSLLQEMREELSRRIVNHLRQTG